MSPRFAIRRRSTAEPDPTTQATVPSAEPAAPTETVAPTETEGLKTDGSTQLTDDAADFGGRGAAGGEGSHAALVALAEYPYAVLSWVSEDAYPINVAIELEVRPGEDVVRFSEPPGFKVPPGSLIGITGSHVHPLADGGFDERRHVTVWGLATPRPRGRFVLKPDRVWAWDELDLPRPAAYERALPRARRYYQALSAERGTPVRPRLSADWMLSRLIRAPFLSAIFVPVLLGLAVAARVGRFDAFTAVITLIAATSLLVGLNAANYVFDPFSGAGEFGLLPVRHAGAFRGLRSAYSALRDSGPAVGGYAVAAALWLLLTLIRGSAELVAISAVGFLVVIACSIPPLKLRQRGLGEIVATVGFGPIMLLGTFAIQSRGSVSAEALIASLPSALLLAMILYVHEVSVRAADARAGKLTLPVRWSRGTVIRGFDLAASASFALVLAGVAVGLLPLPALLVLLAIPLGFRVHLGLVRFYDSPASLVETRERSVRLHLAVGLLLLAGYLLAAADQALFGLRAFLW